MPATAEAAGGFRPVRCGTCPRPRIVDVDLERKCVRYKCPDCKRVHTLYFEEPRVDDPRPIG